MVVRIGKDNWLGDIWANFDRNGTAVATTIVASRADPSEQAETASPSALPRVSEEMDRVRSDTARLIEEAAEQAERRAVAAEARGDHTQARLCWRIADLRASVARALSSHSSRTVL